MSFTRRLLPVVVLALLVGCSQLPQTAAPRTQGDAPANDTNRVAPMPNPYLSSQMPLPQQVRTTFEQAQQAMQAQQWQQAQALLEQITRTHPKLSGPYVNLGLVYRQQERYDRAADAFRRAIKANPLNGEAYNQLAILHRERGEFEQAEKLYLQALDVWPHNPVIHRNLGILYDLYMGRFDDALHHYQASQKVATEPERQVEGWIVDLKRRLAEQQQAAVQRAGESRVHR